MLTLTLVFFNYRQFSASLQLVSLFSNTAPVRNVYITPIYEQSLQQKDASAAAFNFHNITEKNKILKILNGNKLSIYVSVIKNSVVSTKQPLLFSYSIFSVVYILSEKSEKYRYLLDTEVNLVRIKIRLENFV